MRITLPSRRKIWRTSHCSRMAHMHDAKSASLRKQVLIRCLRARLSKSHIHDLAENHDSPSREESQADLDALKFMSLENKPRERAQIPRRASTISRSQRIIQHRVDELKLCLRRVHANAWLLRQAAAYGHCPEPEKADLRAFFLQKFTHLVDYNNRFAGAWETELKTLLHALRAPPWDNTFWRDSLNLVLDSIYVVIEAM